MLQDVYRCVCRMWTDAQGGACCRMCTGACAECEQVRRTGHAAGCGQMHAAGCVQVRGTVGGPLRAKCAGHIVACIWSLHPHYGHVPFLAVWSLQLQVQRPMSAANQSAARTTPRRTNPYMDYPSPHLNPSPNPAPPCPDAAARTPPRQSATRRRRGRPSCWTGRCCRPRCGGVWYVRCVRWYAVVCGVWWWVVYNDVWCAVWCVLTHAPCLLTHMSLHGAV